MTPLKLLPLVLAVSLTATAQAAPCPRPDALGTARTLAVDAKTYPSVGLKSFPQTLPLADKEVVLTFDDGPSPPFTNRVLAALSDQCVQATFFLVGRTVAANAALVRRIAAEGHSVGIHTWSHQMLDTLPPARAQQEIDRGIAAVQAVLGSNTAPFFRFPFFASTPALLDYVHSRGYSVFGADLWASDWNKMTPEVQLKLLTERLAFARKGIILLHDPRQQTAAMLPAFLRYLKANGYKVVHVIPSQARTLATH
ncbi:polysaccharide deacetylase [Afipia sp. Root123D2]|uniref:polysaccharide deacetylase family protein n=1 Tax=Afipia sp. Root123D2 TaxID=1736436 RepID=UPI0007002E96|nr:polysaccharide deacetylase family protein [Afipia sp. Root123D2]KQW22695.1 polysaccharide deacetylase [Afipia sp. Root123D2]